MKKDHLQINRLVEETQKGNTKAFGELYDLFFAEIHKYVSYKVALDQVDDVVSSIFLKCWMNIKKYRRLQTHFSAWLYRLAHNTVIDHYRTHRQFYELEEKIADEESGSPALFAEKQLNAERIQRAVRKLGQPYQDVILLKFMNHQSNRDIAVVLKTNESNVRTLQFRALKKLKTMLEDEKQPLETAIKKQEKFAFLKRIFVKP